MRAAEWWERRRAAVRPGARWLGRRTRTALASGREVRQALARSQTTLQHTLELTETGSWDWDVATNAVHWPENLGPIHGLPRGSQPSDDGAFLELIHPDDREEISSAVDRALCRRLVEELAPDASSTDDTVVVAVRTLSASTNPFREVFPAQPEELRRVRAAARTWLADAQVPAARSGDIVLVLGEACANAVEHAYAGREPGALSEHVAVDTGVDGTEVTVAGGVLRLTHLDEIEVVDSA